MGKKIDFEIVDSSAVTIRPLTTRARAWLLEACEIADIEYKGGMLTLETELGHDLIGSLENTDMELVIV